MWSGTESSVAATGMPCSRSVDVGSAGPSSTLHPRDRPSVDQRRPGAGGGGTIGAGPQHVRDHHRIGEHRLTRWPDPSGQRIDIRRSRGSAKATARTLPSNRRATAPNSRATSAGMAAAASGPG